MPTCHKYGFKNVQALRQWHGQPGWFFNVGDIGLYLCVSDEDGDTCSFNFFNDYNIAASQTKYTALSYTVDYSVTSPFGPGCSDEYSASLSLDASIGVVTVDSFSGGTGNAITYAADFGGTTQDAASILNSGPIGLLNSAANTFGIPGPDEGYTGSCGADGYSFTDSFGNTYFVSWTIDSGSVSFSGSNINDDGYGQSFSGSVTDSELSFTFYLNTGGPDAMTVNYSISATLSGSNTSADIQTDIATLLDEWDLTDDAQYQWRTDGSTSIAPLVTRNEVPENVALLGFGPGTSTDTLIDDCYGNAPDSPYYITTYEQTAATDPNAALYDGSIVGSPMPAGYQGFFDFAFEDYQVCETGDPPFLYLNGWGQSVYDAATGIPLNATQWTNNQMAASFGPGAWIFYNANPDFAGCNGEGGSTYTNATSVACYAQKWAETKMAFPSQNFARPGGMDRFLYDECFVYNICGTSNMGEGPGGNNQGAKITIVQTANCGAASPGVTSGCANAGTPGTGGLWGGPAVGGFYEIASVAAATDAGCADACVVTLGALVYALPSDWESSSSSFSFSSSTFETDGAYCFGLLRWSTGNPSTDPPAILGRAAISLVGQCVPPVSGSSQLTTDTLTTLGLCQTADTYDYVDIYDAQMNLISGGSDLPVARISDTTFTVPVAVSTLSGAGVPPAFLMSHGAPHYYWNDQYPKGDYAYTDWTLWPRQICEASRINAIASDCAGGDDCSGCPDTETIYQFPYSAFTQEAGCVAFTPCNPSVLCISPNGETFANGTTYDFPAIDFDEQYGSGWQADFQQVMEDLYYQAPHYPAQGSDCIDLPYEWLADDGSCETPSSGPPAIQYYPHAPMVECRLTLPDNGGPYGDETAPALTQPTDAVEYCSVNAIVIGWTSPVGILNGDCYPYNTLFPPTANGLGFESFNAWNLWENLCSCVQDTGEFSNEYENQVVGCS